MKIVKCVVVGDQSAEKTLLLQSFVTLMEGKEWPPEYVPTVFEYTAVKLKLDGQVYSLTLWDTTGEEDFGRLRPVSYHGADVFIVCFAVTSSHSLQVAKDIWIPDIKKWSPKTPFLLVGTQLDKLATLSASGDGNNRCDKPVKTSVATKVAKKCGAAGYLECSAYERQGVRGVFEAAVRATTHVPVWDAGGPRRIRQVTRTLGNFLTESYTALRSVEFTIRGMVSLLRGMSVGKYMELHRNYYRSRRSIASTTGSEEFNIGRSSSRKPNMYEDRKFSLQ
ncbi:cell division control protein 42 homolog [Ptychodera flava]|uniref:cell division control protein 42 homolog n=1 Tax=Ptychodera flava TaxID=63121 RepID=UPI00396A7AEF